VAWVVWHISLDRRRLRFDYWRGEVRSCFDDKSFGNHSPSESIGLGGKLGFVFLLLRKRQLPMPPPRDSDPEACFFGLRKAGREANRNVETV
jgi:hypothetical protein